MTRLDRLGTSTRPWRSALVATAALASGLIAAPALGQNESQDAPAGRFDDRVDVTAVELMIDVRDKKGKAVGGLGPEDFEVLEDGQPVEVIAVDPPTEPRWVIASAGHLTRAQRQASTNPWRVLIYIEGRLTDAKAVENAARALAKQATELTDLGLVEVVVADPSPRIVLPFSRDPEQLRQALRGIESSRSSNEIAKLRRLFLSFRDMRGQVVIDADLIEAQEVIGQIRTAVQQEKLLLESQLARFESWLALYGRHPASALILISEGFDLDPSDFYLKASTIPEVQRELATELNRFRVEQSATRVSQTLTANGWTAVALAAASGRGSGPQDAAADASMSGRERFRSIGESNQFSSGPDSASITSLLQQPLEPLRQLSDDSGGELFTSLRKSARAIARLGERLRLTYQVARPADAERRRVEVRLGRRDLELRAPSWTLSSTPGQTAVARARRMLELGQGGGELPVEVTVDVGEAEGTAPRRAELEVLFDLNPLRQHLDDPRVELRFTLAVALPKGPFVHQIREQVLVPGLAEESPFPRFDYTTALSLPPEAGRLVVVIDEISSGFWGGDVVEPGP